MYKDLLIEYFSNTNQIKNQSQTSLPKEKRFQGIFKSEPISSSSSSDDDQVKLGEKVLSSRKKQKIINYLFNEINISR